MQCKNLCFRLTLSTGSFKAAPQNFSIHGISGGSPVRVCVLVSIHFGHNNLGASFDCLKLLFACKYRVTE